LIIDVPRGVTQIGALDVVTLNKGQRDGLVEGNVLVVMKTGETVRDRITGQPLKIPDERAGLLMVFRTSLMGSDRNQVTDRPKGAQAGGFWRSRRQRRKVL
jgi:hypothetical protein